MVFGVLLPWGSARALACCQQGALPKCSVSIPPGALGLAVHCWQRSFSTQVFLFVLFAHSTRAQVLFLCSGACEFLLQSAPCISTSSRWGRPCSALLELLLLVGQGTDSCKLCTQLAADSQRSQHLRACLGLLGGKAPVRRGESLSHCSQDISEMSYPAVVQPPSGPLNLRELS